MFELHHLTALEQRQWLHEGRLEPRDLVEHYLARIEKLNDEVGAFTVVEAQRAREAAQRIAHEVPRTAPLWGIGLTETVSGHTLFLHDGRARNLTEAILWHGGEAQGARDAFADLSKEDRARLLAFVNSL